MDLAPGTVVTDRVKLLRPLAEGGMGSVWVAEHTGLGTEVAVKFITDVLPRRNPELSARFRREAQAAAKLQSPYVVSTFDHGVMEDGTPFIVMELLCGESLADRIARPPGLLSPAELQPLLVQVASALDAAHAIGIVHRDLKPANIFLNRSGREIFAKVLDFGIAKQADACGSAAAPATRTGVIMGTPQYMSPEQLMSAKDADLQADLWALAVVAYQALTGLLPFEGETLAALAVAITTGDFPPPSSTRGAALLALDPWFARALARCPADRFASAGEMAAAFAAAITTAQSPSMSAPSPRLSGVPASNEQPPGDLPSGGKGLGEGQPRGAIAPTVPSSPALVAGSPAPPDPPATLGGAARSLISLRPRRVAVVLGAFVAIGAIATGVTLIGWNSLFGRRDSTCGRDVDCEGELVCFDRHCRPLATTPSVAAVLPAAANPVLPPASGAPRMPALPPDPECPMGRPAVTSSIGPVRRQVRDDTCRQGDICGYVLGVATSFVCATNGAEWAETMTGTLAQRGMSDGRVFLLDHIDGRRGVGIAFDSEQRKQQTSAALNISPNITSVVFPGVTVWRPISGTNAKAGVQ